MKLIEVWLGGTTDMLRFGAKPVPGMDPGVVQYGHRRAMKFVVDRRSAMARLWPMVEARDLSTIGLLSLATVMMTVMVVNPLMGNPVLVFTFTTGIPLTVLSLVLWRVIERLWRYRNDLGIHEAGGQLVCGLTFTEAGGPSSTAGRAWSLASTAVKVARRGLSDVAVVPVEHDLMEIHDVLSRANLMLATDRQLAQDQNKDVRPSAETEALWDEAGVMADALVEKVRDLVSGRKVLPRQAPNVWQPDGASLPAPELLNEGDLQ